MKKKPTQDFGPLGEHPTSVFAGLLDQLTPERQLQATQAEITNAWNALCEIARKRDVPHEVFEILGNLREQQQEFTWYEKVPVLKPTPHTIARLKEAAKRILELP